MEETLHEAALNVIQEKLKDGNYLLENFNIIRSLHHRGSSNPVYEVTHKDTGHLRAVKDVRLKFDQRLSSDISSTLSVPDGIAVTKFLKCIQESILVQNKFSSNPCIVSIYDTWLQLTKEQSEPILAQDIHNLCDLVRTIKSDSETYIKPEVRNSLIRIEGYSIFLEMELYKDNLENHLESQKNDLADFGAMSLSNTPIQASKWVQMVSDIAKALEEVHRKGYVHCDVKPRNVFVDSAGSLYLGDFGSAKLNHSMCQSGSVQYAGTTPCYNTDPNGPRGYCFDIWSLGCTIIRIFSKDPSEFKKFFSDSNNPKPVPNFRDKLKDWNESGRLDDEAYSVILGCLESPNKRHSAKDILTKTHELATYSPTTWQPLSPFNIMETTEH